MKYNDYIGSLKSLESFLSNDIQNFACIEAVDIDNKPFIKDWSDLNNQPLPERDDGVCDKSGVYFFLNKDDEVLYIGKACENNSQHRIWSHLKKTCARQ